MLKKKCKSCAKKVERRFNYCPYCGASFKAIKEEEDFGMLGIDDSNDMAQEELKLPFGVEKMMNSLINQLEKQMGDMSFENTKGMPKGIKIRIAKGPPMGQMIQKTPKRKIEMPQISEEEIERRINLPKVDAESKVRRISDTIIYEINTPGVNKKEDVVLTELATGLEIKAYSRNRCYVKFIPLKVEIVKYYVQKEKVFVELKG